jgi:hypothetical protein
MVVPLQDAALVRPGLYLASARAEKDAAALRSAGITHVLQVPAALRPHVPGTPPSCAVLCWTERHREAASHPGCPPRLPLLLSLLLSRWVPNCGHHIRAPLHTCSLRRSTCHPKT